MEKQELFEIIAQAKKGDPAAFEKLIVEYKGHVYRQALATVHDPMEAEDITQEAFIKAYYSIKKLDQEYAFVSWLTRIVSNLCYDKLKQRSKEREKQQEVIDQRTKESRSSFVERTNARLSVEEALGKLSNEHREAIVLRDLQGFSYKEMAEILKIPLGTVKSRISLAREELKQLLIEGEQNE